MDAAVLAAEAGWGIHMNGFTTAPSMLVRLPSHPLPPLLLLLLLLMLSAAC